MVQIICLECGLRDSSRTYSSLEKAGWVKTRRGWFCLKHRQHSVLHHITLRVPLPYVKQMEQLEGSLSDQIRDFVKAGLQK